ncbi:MAG: polysaccharide deacetylase family protein [Patescibacteria group bacterium]
MKIYIKNIAYRIASLFPTKGAVILMYHSVGDNGKLFTVTSENFARQMQYLHDHHFSVLGLEDAVSRMQKNDLPPRSVVITFDDGYQDNYTNAFPVLRQYRFPATIFVNRNVEGLEALSEQGIKEMAASGLVTFGSHAHRHVKLAQLSDAEIETELAVSKKTLEGITGTEVRALAYPYGSYDARVKNIAAQHYHLACAVHKGRVTASSDMLALSRNSIDSEVTLTQFKGIVRRGRL